MMLMSFESLSTNIILVPNFFLVFLNHMNFLFLFNFLIS